MNLKLNLLLSVFAASAMLPQSVLADEHKPIILAQQQTPAKKDPAADDKKPAPTKPAAQATQPQTKPAPAKPTATQNKPAQNAQQPKPQPSVNNQNKPNPAKPASQPAAGTPKNNASPATQRQPANKPAAQQDKQPAATKPAATTPQQNKQQPTANQPDAKPANQPAAAQDKTPAAQPADQKAAAAARDAAPKKIEAARAERKETKEGNRTVIRENNRTIVKINNTTIIRHDDTDRFRHGGGDIRVNRRGDRTETVIVRPGGVRIINLVDDNGRLVRRSRWVNGREYVLIDNRYDRPGSGFGFIVTLPPPVISIPRERYIVDYRVAPRPVLYETLTAPPVMALDRRFTLDEIRYNAVVRQRMPSIDIDSITFESGSWEITPDQARLLEPLAEAMGRAIAKNPAEVYLIGGNTDSVGDPEDNLSLSDRRAEAVAEVLTSQFNIPPESLIPQGYGETNLRVNVQGPEPRNRYVSIRRITPLLKTAQK